MKLTVISISKEDICDTDCTFDSSSFLCKGHLGIAVVSLTVE